MAITKAADVKALIHAGRRDPAAAFAEVERLARSDAWQTREVAATALVEIGKRQPAAVLSAARGWARAADPNLRRAASEGLRGLVKTDPDGVRIVLELLRADPDLYVRKSVANVLRNASARHPDFVLTLCREWGFSTDPHTRWTIREGLRTLARVQPAAVDELLRAASSSRIRLLVVDDHPIVRAGLRDLIVGHPDLTIVAEAENGERALARFREVRPDVTLMDLRMPVMGGPEAIRHIRAEFPEARIIALTTYDGDADIRRALYAGASGYLMKDMLPTEVVAAIRAVARGERAIPVAVAVRLAEHLERDGLTPRELEVLDYVARGFGNKQIATAIGRTDETVKLHVKNIFRKLNVDSRTAAVSVALVRGLVHLPMDRNPTDPPKMGR